MPSPLLGGGSLPSAIASGQGHGLRAVSYMQTCQSGTKYRSFQATAISRSYLSPDHPSNPSHSLPWGVSEQTEPSRADAFEKSSDGSTLEGVGAESLGRQGMVEQ